MTPFTGIHDRQYADPNVLEQLQFNSHISDTRSIQVDVHRTSPYFPVFRRLVVEQQPDRYGIRKGELSSQSFYDDLDKLEEFIFELPKSKFVVNEEDVGLLIALKNYLLMALKNETLGVPSFETIAEKNRYARRVLSFFSMLKKKEVKHYKNQYLACIRNGEAGSLLDLGYTHFLGGEYQFSEAVYSKLVHKVHLFSTTDKKTINDFSHECYFHLARIYLEKKMYGAALRCNQQAVNLFAPEILVTRGNYQKDLRILTELALIHLKNENKDEAKCLFEQSLDASHKMRKKIRKFFEEKEKLLENSHLVMFAEVDRAYKLMQRMVATAKEAEQFLGKQIAVISGILERLRTSLQPSAPSKKEGESKKELQLESKDDKDVEDTKPLRPSTPPSREHDNHLLAKLYTKETKGKKKAKAKGEAVSAATPKPAVMVTPRVTVSQREGFMSLYVTNDQTGAGYIFRLNLQHLEAHIQDKDVRSRVLRKFAEAIFVCGKGKQGFKFAAHEEKAAAAGYCIKLKLLGSEGLGNLRLFGRKSSETGDEEITEIIFDGIDLNAHSSKSAIIVPREN